MRLVRTKAVRWIRASAVTVFPFVFLDPDIIWENPIKGHEGAHYEQQRRWAMYGLGIGLLVWFALYLLVLPVGWNPFREKCEREAFRAGGWYQSWEVDQILKKPPYYLWW